MSAPDYDHLPNSLPYIKCLGLQLGLYEIRQPRGTSVLIDMCHQRVMRNAILAMAG